MTLAHINRLNHFVVLLIVVSSQLVQNCSYANESGERPNFLVFIVDDLNKEYYGCYGHPKTASPTVDRLASEGMVFDNAFTGQAICATSRSMLYSGKYPLRNGSFMNHTAVYEGTRTVCHYLQELNYDVILCGKSHVKPASAFPWTHAMHHPKPKGDQQAKANRSMPLDKLESYFEQNKGHKRRPFCVFASSHYPHGEHPERTSFSADSIAVTRFHADTAKNRKSEARFSQAIKYSDDELSRSLELLDKYNHTDNTIVIFVSDHGRFGKWSVYDRGLNVPFVVRWPGVVKSGSRSDALVSFADVLPTMLEVAGADHVSDFDGKSFLPVLKGTTQSHQKYVYGVMINQGIINAHVFPGRTIRSEQYRYIRNYNTLAAVERREAAGEKHTEILRMGAEKYPDVPEEELFDVIADPEEKHNLADHPQHQEVKKELQQELQNWLIAQNDFMKNEGAMPFLATHKQYRLDVLSHPKNKVELPERLKHSLDGYKFYEHQ
jgi:uncharacterized sulfatase